MMIMLFKKFFSASILVFLLITVNANAIFSQQFLNISDNTNIETNDCLKQINRNNNFYPICQTMQSRRIVINESKNKPHLQEMPSSFSWKNNDGDWTTPVKYQGDCGSCWDFAALGILEAVINIKENNPGLDPDLSEQYVLSCLPSSGSCYGGIPYKALQLIMKTNEQGNYCNGVPIESCMPYQADDDIPCSDKCPDWQDKLIPVLDYGKWDSDGSEEDRQRIKTQIMQNGPVATGIYASDDFKTWGLLHHNPSQYYPYNGHVIWNNHVIVIVGWHDDSTIDNGGYWICKNSWGSFWGYNGFFNIEYGAQCIDRGYVVWVDYDPESYNWPPVACSGGPYWGDIKEQVSFSAVESFDVEGDITSYHWSFGDGKATDGKTVTHSYANKGIYQVTLTVTDETGKQDSQDTAVFIEPWSIGNKWEYCFDEISFTLDQDITFLDLQGNIPSVTFEIEKETDEFYEMSFGGSLNGDFNIVFSGMELQAQLSKTALSGNVLISKSNHGIKKIDGYIDGRIRFPELLPIPISFKFNADMTIEFKSGFKYIDFPIYDQKEYDIQSSEMTINGNLSSRLLNLLNIVNNIASLFGKGFLPENICALLPTFDFGEALNIFIGNNTLMMPCLSSLQVNETTINVEAGTFSGYNITTLDIGGFCYAPAVENIVKIDISAPFITTLNGNINLDVRGELISTNYK